MPSSQARILVNRQNSLKSTGPRTTEGKERSRANGLKHGLTGAGIVLAEQDKSEIERRNADLQREIAPATAMGVIMIQQMATQSVRMERSANQETAAIEIRVRHAAEVFDQERLEEADHLLDILGEDPRRNLRKLLRMPEGVDRLMEAWQDLCLDLIREEGPLWTADHRERAENLTGRRIEDAVRSTVGTLSKEIWGDFGPDAEPGEAKARQARARLQLVDYIEQQLADLEEHRETLDFETIAIDRAEAGTRALFDPSREAALARRYEAESTRNFHRALKELRRAEAEAAALAEARPTPPAPARPTAPLASSWEGPPPTPRPTPPPTPQPAPPVANPFFARPIDPNSPENGKSA